MLLFSQAKCIADASLGKVVDYNTSYYPYVGTAFLKLGHFAVDGTYAYNNTQRSEVQVVDPLQSFGFNLSYFTSAGNDEMNFIGFSVGYSQNELLKRITISDPLLYPTDEANQAFELDKFYMGYQTQVISIGLKAVSISDQNTKRLEKFADDFDMNFIKKRNLNSILKFDMQLLYAPKLAHDTSFRYSPYGLFVPKPLTIHQPLKAKKFGVYFRFMWTPYMKLGFSMDLGILPGYKFENDTENAINLTMKAGLHFNPFYSSKK